MTPEAFLQLTDLLPEPTLLVRGDGTILAANRASEERLSLPINEIRDRTLSQYVAETPQEVAAYLRVCSRSKKLILGALTLSHQPSRSIACRTEGALLRPRAENAGPLLLLRLLPKSSAVGQFVALNQRIDDLGKEVRARRQAEDTLRQQQKWLQVTLSSIGDAVIATDTAGLITFMNPVAEALTGWSPADAHGIRLEAVFHIINEHSRQLVENPVVKVLREGHIVGLANHTILIARDGTEIPIDDSAAPIRDEAGSLQGVVLVFRDITEKKQSERELWRSAEQARTILESITDAFFALDRDWRFTYVNRQAESLLERSPGDLLGKVLWEEYSGLVDTEFERIYRRAADEKVSLSLTSYYPDHGRWYEIHVYPTLDGVSAYFRNVTERHELLNKLEDERIRLRAIVENVPAGIVLARAPSGQTVLVNTQVGEILRQPVPTGQFAVFEHWAGYHANGATVQPQEWPLARALAGDTVRGEEFLFQRGDGTKAWIRMSAAPILRDGTPVGGVVAIYDIDAEKQAEASIRDAEQRWRDLAEALPNLVWTDLPNGECDYLSSQWSAYTGIPVSELLGFAWVERVLHPDDRDRTLSCWMTAVEDKGVYDLEYRIRRYDGAYHWFKTRGVPIRDDQGRIIKWFGTCTDIEDQKQAVEKLRESEDRFRQLADAMPQIVYTAAPDGRTEYLNRRWYEYTGLVAENASSPDWIGVIHPEDREGCIAEAVRTNRAGIPFEMELRFQEGRTGQYRWHLARSLPVRNDKGDIIRWYGTSTDIHEQKRSGDVARFLAEASAALSTLVDYESTLRKVTRLAVPFFADWSAVDVVKADGTLRRLSVFHKDVDRIELAQEVMRRYPPEPGAIGGPAYVLRTAQPEIVAEITDEMLAKTAQDENHLQLLRALGLRSYICVPLVVSGNAVGVLTFATAESGRVYSAVDLALAEDLAQRAAIAIENAQLYRALKEADRKKDEFLAVLAHELRNPLAPLSNALQIMRLTAPEGQSAVVRDMMDRQVRQMTRLVDDLLDVSRITSGKITLRNERMDLAEVVQNALETSRPIIESSNHQLVVKQPDRPLHVEGDKTRLAQVLSNLLTNAAKYTSEGGRIWLTIERQNVEAVLRVRDDGVGIPKEMLPKIFEMFTQVDRNLGRSQGGLGIGLTLVKSLVEMHKGTIEGRSDGPGAGSEFIVKLPLAPGLTSAEAGESQRPIDSLSTEASVRHRVLVVDDNVDSAESLAIMLRLAGNEVRTAHDGLTGIDIASTFTPDVVLLDIGLPGIDGYEVARRLRLMPALQNALLVAQTGWGQQEDRRRSGQAGFDHHFTKPIDPAALQALLAKLA